LAGYLRGTSLLGEAHTPFMDLLAIDAHRRRRLDPKTHAIALNGDHGDADVISDDNFLPDMARKYEHGSPSWESPLRWLRPGWGSVSVSFSSLF
jgi:hypothetical protein